MLRRGNKQRKETGEGAPQQSAAYPANPLPTATSPYMTNTAMAQGSVASLQYMPQQQQQQSQQQQQQGYQSQYGFNPSAQGPSIPPAAAFNQQQQSQQQQQYHSQSSSGGRGEPAGPGSSYPYPSAAGLPSPSFPSATSPIPGAQPSTSMGRSQSALNFFLSKAKGTFGSSSNNQPTASASHAAALNTAMASSTSLSSLPAHPDSAAGADDPMLAQRGGYSGAYPVFIEPAQQQGRFPASTSSRSGSQQQQQQPGGLAGVSLGLDEPVNSPTKRTFFGMTRDRKASNASQNKSTSGAGPAPSHPPPPPPHHHHYPARVGTPGPPARSGTPSNTSPGLPYGAFSKSQSDLLSTSAGTIPSSLGGRHDHAGGHGSSPSRKLSFDYRGNSRVTGGASPLGTYSQLPPLTGGQEDTGRYLRSPTSSTGPGGAFSRSVDDLTPSPTLGGASLAGNNTNALGSGAAKAHYHQQLQQLPPPPPIPHDGTNQSPTLKGARQRGFGIGIGASPILKGERKVFGGGSSGAQYHDTALPPLPTNSAAYERAAAGSSSSASSYGPAGGVPPVPVPRHRELSAGAAKGGPGNHPGFPGPAAFAGGHGRSESIPLSSVSNNIAAGQGNSGSIPNASTPLSHAASGGGGGISGLFHAAVGVASGATRSGSSQSAGVGGAGSGGGVPASQSVDSTLLFSPAGGLDARHQRRPSKLSAFPNMSGSAGGAGGAGALSGATLPPTGVPAPPLPNGTTFQGFLLRNGNISLTLQQLSEGANASNEFSGGKGKEKEKDISRGWKPYRVLLTTDGRVLFFKPPNTMADEVRAAFPTTLVRAITPAGALGAAGPGAAGGAAGLGFGQMPMTLDAEALKKAGLSQQSLLQNMTSRGAGPGSQPQGSGPVMGGLAMTTSGSGGAGPFNAAPPAPAPVEDSNRAPPAWHQDGHHAELILSNDEKAPARWASRVIRGSVDALGHELVFATQLVLSKSSNSNASESNKGLAILRDVNSDDAGVSAEPDSIESGEMLRSNENERESTGLISAALLNLIRFGHPVMALAQAINRWASQALTIEDVTKLPAAVQQRLAAGQPDEAEAETPQQASPMNRFHDEVRTRLVRFLEIVQMDDALDANPAVHDILESLATLASTSEKPFQLSPATLSSPTDTNGQLAFAPPHSFTDWVAKLAEQSHGSSQTRPELNALVQSRFGGQVLLGLDQLEVAQQISLFHRDRLQYLISPRLTLSKLTATGEAHATQQQARSLFSFDSLVPHYLTRLVLDQLLPTGTTGMADGINKRLAAGPHHHHSQQSGQPAPPQAAKQRAALIRHWIAVAIHLHALGDYAGWVAICAALCSRAVARLEATWRFVADKDRQLVGETWAPKLAQLGWAEGIRGRIDALVTDPDPSRAGKRPSSTTPVPFFGDACVAVRRLPAAAPGSGQLIVADNLDAAERVFGLVFDGQQRDAALSAFINTNGATASAKFEPIVEYQATLQALANARVDTDVGRYLSHSLHAEPKTLGAIFPYWRQPRPSRATSNALVPLMFSQPLPHLSLVDRASIIAGVSRGNETSKSTSAALLDPERTITGRPVGQRAQLSGSPLARSLTFPTNAGSRSVRTFPFGRIEWGSYPGNATGSSEEHVLRIGPDLIVRTVTDVSPSTPSSPRASKRFSQDMSRQSRPVSQVSKRSSLPASNRSSYIDTPAVLEVTLKAASLEKIVDIMVMGVDHVTTTLPDDNGEQPLSSARKARLSMDLPAFRQAFLATFRTLCSPNVLLRMLVKRFAAAEAAGAELAMPVPTWTEPWFPTWQAPHGAAHADHPVDWEMTNTIKAGVLTTLQTWFERFAQDFAEDKDLYEAANTFFSQMPQIIDTANADSEGDESSNSSPARASAKRIAAQLRTTEQAFRLRVMTPNTAHPPTDDSTSPPLVDLLAAGPTSVDVDIDSISPSDLVNYLECIAAAFFRKVQERDLLITAEVFESQASNILGWYPNRQAPGGSSRNDTPEAWTLSLYKLMEALVQASESGENLSMLSRLPTAIRDVLAVHQLLKGWLAVLIIEVKIGLRKRQARLERMLDAVWICRARMSRSKSGSNATLDATAPFKEQTVASFVETALLGALTTPESRLFVRAWQGVAMSRNASGEQLKDLFPVTSKFADLDAASNLPSIPDLGWILQTLAEAVSREFPETEAAAQLINFDKQRLVYNLVQSSVRSRVFSVRSSLTDLASQRLRSMQTTLRSAVWDPRLFKEDAALEAGGASPAIIPQLKGRSLRPLSGLVQEEQEKARRQRQAQEFLVTLSRNSENERRPKSPDENFRSMTPILTAAPSSQAMSPPPPTQAEKKTRRMTAIFRGAVRLTEKPERPEIPNRPLNEMIRLTPLQKASYAAGCGNAQVAIWHNTQRSFVFHLTSQEGAKYLLQAPTASDLSEWVNRLETASKQFAPPRGAAEAGKGASGGRTAFTPLWGPTLVELAEKEGREVPLGLERMLAEIEARGLREQGIYRISGAKSAIMGLKDAFSRQAPESIDLATGEYSDVHTIAGAVKQWFRDLPNPPVPFSHYDRLIEAETIKDPDARLYQIRELLWEFPKPHFDTLRRMFEHLARVAEEAQHNKMFQHNLGLVFATSLLNPPPAPDSLTRSFANVGKAAHIVALILDAHEWLFEPEPEPEPEVEAEPVPDAEEERDAAGEAEGDEQEDNGLDPEQAETATLQGVEAGVVAEESSQALASELEDEQAVRDGDDEANEDPLADLAEDEDEEDVKSDESVKIQLPPLNFTPAPSESAHGLAAFVTGSQSPETGTLVSDATAHVTRSEATEETAAERDSTGGIDASESGPIQSTSGQSLAVSLSSDLNKSSEALAADIEEMLDVGMSRIPDQRFDPSKPTFGALSSTGSEVDLVTPFAPNNQESFARNTTAPPVSRRRVGGKEESVYLDATDALEALDFAALSVPSSPPGYQIVRTRRPSEAAYLTESRAVTPSATLDKVEATEPEKTHEIKEPPLKEGNTGVAVPTENVGLAMQQPAVPTEAGA